MIIDNLNFGAFGIPGTEYVLDLSSEIELSPFSDTIIVTEGNGNDDIVIVTESSSGPIMSNGSSIVKTKKPNTLYYADNLNDLVIVTEKKKKNNYFMDYDLYVDGLNEYAHIQISKAMKKAFLHDYLHEDYPEILDKLKVVNGKVKVASARDKVKKDTKETLKKKVKFIGSEILTNPKNMKLLRAITKKNKHIRFSDLPANRDLVASTQAKYVKRRIKEMRK